MDLLKTSMVLKCVPLTISDQLYFLRLSKVWSMLHNGSVGNKKCCTMFSYTFFLHFCCFSPLNLCFCHFNFFFWWSIKCPQRNISHWKWELIIRNCQLDCMLQSASLIMAWSYSSMIMGNNLQKYLAIYEYIP